MIAGTQLAVQTPNGMTGCTFKHHSYILPVHGRNFKFFDTAGLDEGDNRTMKHSVAISKIYDLITGLDRNGGISLLMFCMHGPRIKHAMRQNWEVFQEILCKKKVPIVLVVTGLENEENMDAWWWNNRETFECQGIRPDDTACITTIRGRALKDGYCAFDDQYEKSQAKILNTILNRVLHHPWHDNKINWFYRVIRSFISFFQWTKIREPKDIQEIADACARCGMSREETSRLKGELGYY
ncbi:hypothetical protein M405DRAFT_812802 [Rhizopogon salebrosus TDB-379]|nr:hypothetical protein M405DRAFT_812802 [Rhizopogon salebrosus TDB-379]